MSSNGYKVVVISGGQQGEEFVLTKRITRLGSDGGCDIHIAGGDIPAHAASIDAGGDEIVLFNRGEVPLTVSGQSIAPLMSGVWKPGKALLLPGAVQLRLDVYVAAAASPPRTVEIEPYVAPSEPGALPEPSPKGAPVKSGKSNAGPIAFIAACLILVVLMIVKKLAGDGSLPVAGDPQALTWETVWSRLNDEQHLADARYDTIRTDLLKLYRLQNSPDSTDAPRWKSRVLQELIAADRNQSTQDEFPLQLRAFVNKLK